METGGQLTREGRTQGETHGAPGLGKRLHGEGDDLGALESLCAKMILLLYNQGLEMGGWPMGPLQQSGSPLPTRPPPLYLGWVC